MLYFSIRHLYSTFNSANWILPILVQNRSTIIQWHPKKLWKHGFAAQNGSFFISPRWCGSGSWELLNRKRATLENQKWELTMEQTFAAEQMMGPSRQPLKARFGSFNTPPQIFLDSENWFGPSWTKPGKFGKMIVTCTLWTFHVWMCVCGCLCLWVCMCLREIERQKRVCVCFT